MKNIPAPRAILLALIVASTAPVFSQEKPQSSPPSEDKESTYTKTVNDRAAKIVATLGIDDPDKATRVRDIIAQQYRNISAIDDERDAKIKAAKQQASENKEAKEAADAATKAAQAETKAKLDKLHGEYLSKLSAELTPEQVDKVKDGMTYGKLNVTYNAYLKMLPDLTDEQKKQLREWLLEARENAMDAGSANEKSEWFGKYKGKINNYLAKAGIDMKKAEKNLTAKPDASPKSSAK